MSSGRGVSKLLVHSKAHELVRPKNKEGLADNAVKNDPVMNEQFATLPFPNSDTARLLAKSTNSGKSPLTYNPPSPLTIANDQLNDARKLAYKGNFDRALKVARSISIPDIRALAFVSVITNGRLHNMPRQKMKKAYDAALLAAKNIFDVRSMARCQCIIAAEAFEDNFSKLSIATARSIQVPDIRYECLSAIASMMPGKSNPTAISRFISSIPDAFWRANAYADAAEAYFASNSASPEGRDLLNRSILSTRSIRDPNLKDQAKGKTALALLRVKKYDEMFKIVKTISDPYLQCILLTRNAMLETEIQGDAVRMRQMMKQAGIAIDRIRDPSRKSAIIKDLEGFKPTL